MYLIDTGNVVISLKTKWLNEYFNLPKNTVFGDYQVVLNYKSKECYSSGNKETRMMCIRKKKLLELLDQFPSIKDYYVKRAELRRIEFRRVRNIVFIYFYFRLKSFTKKVKI